MCEWHVVICNVIEEMDLVLFEHQAGGNGVDGSIAPAFVEESSVAVKRFKIVEISFRAKPVQVADLEVRPLAMVSQYI